jgi:integrase
VWFYRRLVPAAVRDALGCSAVVRSLKTSDLRIARERGKRLDVEVEGWFQAAREGVLSGGKVNVERERQLIEEVCVRFTSDALQHDRRERIRLRDTEAGDFGFERGEVATMLREENEEGRLPVDAAIGALKKHGVTLTPEALTDLFHAMKPAELRARKLVEADRDTDYTGDSRVELPGERSAQTDLEGRTPRASPSIALAEAANRYKADNVATGTWGPQTAPATIAKLDKFVEAIGGEREVSSITVEDVREWRDRLGLAQGTVRVRCQMVSALLNWCVASGYIAKNVAAGIAPKEPKKKKRAHTSDELRQVFGADLTAMRDKRPDHFWGPLIGLYTGARVSEICQLAVADVDRKSGVLCFQFREDIEGQRLKNEASKRVVPVHPHLITLGFEKYLRERRKNNEAWLLPNCTPNKKGGKGMGATLSAWWSDRKTKLGLSKAVSFHSFRDGVSQALTAAGVLEVVTIQIIGHDNPSMTTGRYGRKLDVSQLSAAIETLDFSAEVDALRSLAAG